MLKWKSKRYNDLKPFDVVSLESLIKRSRDVLLDINEVEFQKQFLLGRTIVKLNTNDLTNDEVEFYHKKFNNSNFDLPTKRQISFRQYNADFNKKEYTLEQNKYIFDGESSNFNNRDGFIVTGMSEVDLYGEYIVPKSNGITTGEWLYLEIPYQTIYEHIKYSVNNAPLEKVREFINEIHIGDELKSIDVIKQTVDRYDTNFPNWNHDFPIKGYLQVKTEGLLFPCYAFNTNMFFDRGTHKIIMMTFNKFDIPILIQIPKQNQFKWYTITRTPMFEVDGERVYLLMLIDRTNEKINFEFTKNKNEANERNLKL